MSPVFVVIADIVSQQSSQVSLVHNDHVVEQVPTYTPNPSLGDAVLPRTSKSRSDRFRAVLFDGRDDVGRELRVSVENEEPLWLIVSPSFAQLQYDPQGVWLTGNIECRIFRRSWPMTKKQYRTPKVSVGTVKKSIAAIASRWLRRKASQRRAGSGSWFACFTQRETVRSEMSKPSLRSSPWMRGAPQVGFSATMRKISSRTSLLIGFLPTACRAREIQLQYSRNPARCQRTTVSGVTRINDLFQPDQTFRKTSQNNLSTELSRGRGRFACRASSCCRRARFSKRSSSRERKTETTQPSRCRRHANIRES